MADSYARTSTSVVESLQDLAAKGLDIYGEEEILENLQAFG